MKRFFAVVLILLLTALPLTAGAESIVGSWSGTLKAAGLSFSASVRFTESGSFSISAGGISSSGSYSYSGGSLTLTPSSPPGYSTTTMSVSLSGDSCTISGTVAGIKGTLSLSRNGSSGDEADEAALSTPYAVWTLEQDGLAHTLSLYSDGWLLWETAMTDAACEGLIREAMNGIEQGALTDVDSVYALLAQIDETDSLIARVTEQDGALLVQPLDNGAGMTLLDPFGAENGVWTLDYALSGGKLTLKGADTSLTFARKGNSEAMPDDDRFLPYLSVEKGDRGELVRRLQQALIDAQLLGGSADGIAGPMTESAINAWKAARGLEQDGVADAQMLLELLREPTQN